MGEAWVNYESGFKQGGGRALHHWRSSGKSIRAAGVFGEISFPGPRSRLAPRIFLWLLDDVKFLKTLLLLAVSTASHAAADPEARTSIPRLQVDRDVVSLSGVHQTPSRKAEIVVQNPLNHAISTALSITGRDASCFTADATQAALDGGKSMTLKIHFTAPQAPGRFSASLRIGGPTEGVLVLLEGVGLAAFEGKNEPSLQTIVHALGMPLDVGGSDLHLDTTRDRIGESLTVPAFRAVDGGKIRITPLARFSPTGTVPFGIIPAGSSELRELGQLADVSAAIPDAHQCLFPPLITGGSFVEIDAPSTPFAFYMKGHKFTAFSHSGIKTEATITHTARIYPVRFFAGRPMANSYLIGFEEASNGDYQDSAFLIENVETAE